MWILRSLCLAVFFATSAFGQDDVRIPPFITKGPTKSDIFRPGNDVLLECIAEGTPAVTYTWKKSGVDLNLNLGNIQKGPGGTITIKEATGMDEGFYQCFAINQFGTAVSTTAHIQKAAIDSPSQTSTVTITVEEGRPFVIPAAQRKSVPKPTYNWESANSTVDPNPMPLHPSKRMQIACNGDLYFAYAKKEDELNGKIYKSTAYNPNLDVKSGGSYAKVIVTSVSKPLPQFGPNITYSSVSEDIALVGGKVILKCFFSANPLPEISWRGPVNNLPVSRHIYSHFDTEVTISNIIESDEGMYSCIAKNDKGSIQHNLHVLVEAAPKFTNGPSSINKTEGESATFYCESYAKPEAQIVWLQNGQPIDVSNAPKRFVFSKNKKSLTIRDVCRDCEDPERRTDLMVIQCNASNVHGYAFASGYLNVLRRTELSLKNQTFIPVNLAKGYRSRFDCTATSDPSTPPTVQWYKMGPHGEESAYSEPPYVNITNGSLIIDTDGNCSATCAKHFVEYRCVGYTDYSRSTAVVTFNVTGSPSDNPLQSNLKWIIIAAVIACFVLLLILLCCIVCQCTKRDEYDVDRKERKTGRDPEKEIEDCGFHDYYPREYEQMKGSQSSIGSANMFKGSVEVVANEYDDEEGDFGEDGSFVGKYSDRPLYK